MLPLGSCSRVACSNYSLNSSKGREFMSYLHDPHTYSWCVAAWCDRTYATSVPASKPHHPPRGAEESRLRHPRCWQVSTCRREGNIHLCTDMAERTFISLWFHYTMPWKYLGNSYIILGGNRLSGWMECICLPCRWHLGYCNWKYTPTYRGFDSFMGYYNAAEDYYTHKLGIYI